MCKKSLHNPKKVSTFAPSKQKDVRQLKKFGEIAQLVRAYDS